MNVYVTYPIENEQRVRKKKNNDDQNVNVSRSTIDFNDVFLFVLFN
jgi:hypothetical protein